MDGVTNQSAKIKTASPGEKADLGVVIVNWNANEFLADNLNSLLQSNGDFKVRIVVVDNASSDGSVKDFKSRFPQVELIENKENLGFAKAVNQGLSVISSRHVLLLNPDMTVDADALSRTLGFLDGHPDVGVVGGSLNRSDGTRLESVRRFPDVWSQAAILLKLHRLFPRLVKSYMREDFDYSKPQEVDQVRGAYFAISRWALDSIGRLDERFFIWFEEVDYCRRVKAVGMKVMYVPDIKVTDFFGRSFAQRSGLWRQKNFSASMSVYFRKWHPGWRSAVISVLRPISIILAALSGLGRS